MQVRQNQGQLPTLKRLPFLQNIQQLHAHNTHVAKLCLQTNIAKDQAYETAKLHYEQHTLQKELQRSRVLQKSEAAKKKSYQTKNKEHYQHNRENLQKLQRLLEERRLRMAKQEQKQMLQSQSIKKGYQKQRRHHHALTLHHSTNSPTRIKLRQEAQLGYSLILLQQNQQKTQAALERKSQHLEESRSLLQAKNDSAYALQKSREKEESKQEEHLQKIIQKYSSTDMRIASIASTAHKAAGTKKSELEKALEKHRQQRSKVKQEKQHSIEADVKTELAKLDHADSSRQKIQEEQLLHMEARRQQKERTVMSNSFYLQEEADKRAQAILKRHHQSMLNLAASKVQRELLKCSNLQDSFKNSIRS